MTANLLSMNDSKTQYLPIVPKSAAWLLDEVNVIRIGDDTVTAATTVRNLGVHFDHHMDMNSLSVQDFTALLQDNSSPCSILSS